ncbi:MAG: hypothetical protein ACREJ4_17230 [Candidatus Methylomirabilaceae bacterium]
MATPQTGHVRRRALAALTCALALLAGATRSGAQLDPTPVKSEEEVLKGIKALRVLMADVNPKEPTHGVSKEAVEAQIKKFLQEKLPAVKLDPKAITLLYVTVNIAGFQNRLGYYGNLNVEVKRPSLILVGKDLPESKIQESKSALATVWAQGVIFTGEVLAPNAVKKAVDGVMDQFIADFRKANR